MANYATLKAAITAAIKQNGNNEITGNLLQQQLLAMVNSLGAGYQFIDVATPDTIPGTPDYKCFYIASTPGTYTNFGGIVLTEGEIAILKYDSSWNKESFGDFQILFSLLGLNPKLISFSIDGYYVNRNTGELVPRDDVSSTDFTPCLPYFYFYDTPVSVNIAYYDNDQNYISGAQVDPDNVPVPYLLSSPAGAAYCRLSTYKANKNDVIISSYNPPALSTPGKKMVSLGDSLTWGYTPNGLPDEGAQLDSFAKLAAEKLECAFVNYGISGSSVSNIAGRNPMCIRYANMDSDADIVTFMGGANDIRNGVPLGNMSDRVDTTYYGALHILMEGLYRKYVLNSKKNVKIIAIVPPQMLSAPADSANGIGTPYPGQEDWANAVVEVARFYGIPYVDFYHSAMIATTIASDFYNTAYGNSGYFNPLIPDGVHLSQRGHIVVSEILAGFVRALY